MFCPNCGSQVAEGAKVCGSCGTMLGEHSDSQNSGNSVPNNSTYTPNPHGKVYSLSVSLMSLLKSPLFLSAVALMVLNCLINLVNISDTFNYIEYQSYVLEHSFDLPSGLFSFIYTIQALIPFALAIGLALLAVVGFTGNGSLLSPAFKTVRYSFIAAAIFEFLTWLVVLLEAFVAGNIEYMFSGGLMNIIFALSNIILPLFIIITYMNIAMYCKNEGKIPFASSASKGLAVIYFVRALIVLLGMIDSNLFTFGLLINLALLCVTGVFFIDYQKKNG